MNLINNVQGDWNTSKGKVRQDLDTIQRTINQILAQINAPVAATPDAPVVITSANTVNSPDTVATKPTGALDGDGTLTDPLGVKVDGTTITVNSLNQLAGASSVSVAAAGALDGDGSSGNPLAVRVDGTTITINGSNYLSVFGGVSILSTSSGNFATSIPAGTTFSSLIVAPGINKVTFPLFAVAQTKYTGYTTGRSLALRYNGNTTDMILLPTVISGGGVASTGRWVYGVGGSTFNRAVGSIDNKAIDIVFSGANSAFTAGDFLSVTVWYLTYDLAI